MRRYTKGLEQGKSIFVGVDLHRLMWQVTVRTEEEELFNGSIPGKWESLRNVLERYRGHQIQVVYEAGYFGFWLHDRIVAYGAGCIVTPPSLLPQEYGNRVKTDRRDSRKLASLLAKGMLKRVWVPSQEELYHRQVIRRRRQLIGDRVRTQNRIKAELRFYGIDLPERRGRWSQIYVGNLHCLRFNNRWMQENFRRLLEEYEFLSGQIKKQTQLLRELAETDKYQERVALLQSIPGVGLIAAMEILLELQDVARFRRAEQLAAYVGLTPSQYSSGEKVRMGRMSKVGKDAVRGTMVEVAWQVIQKDSAMRKKYEQIKARSGSKRSIVAVAHTMLLRTRRMLLDRQPYRTVIAA